VLSISENTSIYVKFGEKIWSFVRWSQITN
jgi:hypothetical protein